MVEHSRPPPTRGVGNERRKSEEKADKDYRHDERETSSAAHPSQTKKLWRNPKAITREEGTGTKKML